MLTIHDPIVSLTDLLLAIEVFIFVYLFYRQQSKQALFRRLIITLFLSLGASSLLGAIFHAFFPNKATTASGFAVWISVAASIGITACVIWCINALILKGNRSFKIMKPLSTFYMAIFLYIVIFINHEFKIIIMFYAPPMIALAFISIIRFLREHIYIWAGLLMGVILSFIAAAVQYLQISLSPTYFNYNATYHLIQGIALIFLFTAFRSMLKNEKV